ncbi:MAG: hypothetical protein GY750_03335, partial [Lentisphaerae bacterium]|nr:hypothetical protein [Lentisphaerota bacterium]
MTDKNMPEPPQPDIEEKDESVSGEIKEYDDDGNLTTVSNFKNGKLEGKFFTYNENTLLIQDSVFADHKLNGESVFYDDDGRIAMKANFINGKLDGPMTI